MEALENIFPTDNEALEKLKGYAINLDYEKVFFEHLGPELKKIFKNKKDKIIYKNFFRSIAIRVWFFRPKKRFTKSVCFIQKICGS